MGTIFIQNRSAAEIAEELVKKRNATKSDAGFINATADVPAGANNKQRMAALYEKYIELKKDNKPDQAEAYADAIAFYNYQREIAQYKKNNPEAYEYEYKSIYSSYREVAVSYAGQLYHNQKRADKAADDKAASEKAKKAEATRVAGLSSQESALETIVGKGNTASREAVEAILNKHLNKLSADMPANERFNRARHAINARLEKEDYWGPINGPNYNALQSALKVIDKQEALEDKAAVDAKKAATKKAEADKAKADENAPLNDKDASAKASKLVLGGKSKAEQDGANHYLTATKEVKGTANRLAAIGYMLQDIENVKKQFNDPNAERHLRLAAGVLYLKGQLQAGGGTDYKDTTWEEFYKRAEAKAIELAKKDSAGEDLSQTYAPGSGGGAVSKGEGGKARIWKYKGESVPESEVPSLGDNQVEALQKKLIAAGLLAETPGADGKYGPLTHAAVKAAAKQSGITDITSIDFYAENDVAKQLLATLEELIAAAGGKAEPEKDEAGEDKAASTTKLRSQFAKEIDAVKEQSTTPINFYNDEQTQEGIKKELGFGLKPSLIKGAVAEKVNAGIKKGAVAQLKADGIELSQADIDAITVNKGIVYSPMLAKIETALGLSVVDGKMDANLKEIMAIPAIKTALAEAYKAGNIDSLAEPVTPSVPGGKAKGNEKA